MKFNTDALKVVVVGSSSIDLVLSTHEIPTDGETVMAYNSESFFGGKGANQAVAASRLGAQVHFIGCVGMDPFGQQIMRNLVDEGVNVGFVKETEKSSTGAAYVTSVEGKNAIVVVPAANSFLKTKDVEEAEKYIATADIVLLQLEISMEVVDFTVKLAKKHNRKVGIYAAPAKTLSEETKDFATFIVAKSHELSLVFGNDSNENILQKYPNKLFIRNKDNSTTYFNGSEMIYTENHDHDSYYKMGMGDAFTVGFAIALCHGNSIQESVDFGNEVSLRVAKEKGSQKGLPYLKDIQF